MPGYIPYTKINEEGDLQKIELIAHYDEDGNSIKETYATKDEVEFSNADIEGAISRANTAANNANTAASNIETLEEEITTAESGRVSAENARKTAETARQTAETNRASAFTSAQNARQQAYEDAEAERDEAFNSAEAQRNSSVNTAISNANSAATRANNAATSANEAADNANEAAETAATVADSADTKATDALEKATTAETNASNAVSTANSAKTIAEQAKTAADTALQPSDKTALQNSINAKANTSDLTAHIDDTENPHNVTKAQIGLENVENKSSATIRSELTKANVTTALGYTPPTENTVYTHPESHPATMITGLADVATTGEYADLNGVPTKLSDFTNDKGFISSIPTEYVTETELNAKGYLTSHQDISGKADKTTVTALTNRVSANETAISTLNGTGTGSVDKKIADAINKFATDASTDGTVNPYKELIDYAASHGAEFTELVGVVDSNTKAIATKADANHNHNGVYAPIGAEANVQSDWNETNTASDAYIKNKPTSMTPTAHNQASNTINVMTGYSKPSATSAIAATDTLNTAIGKLEKALDGKAASSHGNHVPATETANNAKFLRNDNTWALVTPANIGAATKAEGIFFIEGSGTTDSDAKTSTWIGSSDRITSYYDGLTIKYKIGVVGQTTITLNINGLGAKIVYRISTTKLTTQFPVGSIITLTYHTDLNDGCWIVNDYDANTTYTNVKLGHGYATCTTAAATTAKVATLSSYTLATGGIVAVKFTYDVPANATLNINSKGAKNIYHKGSKIAAGVINAGDTATFIYSSQYHLISIDRDTAYEEVTTTTAGLMSAADKIKLDNITATYENGVLRLTI